MIFLKRQNYRVKNRSVVAGGEYGKRGDYNRVKPGSFEDDGTNLHSISINSPSPQGFLVLRAGVVHLFSDFSKLLLQRLYFWSCMLTEVSVLLSQQSASDWKIFPYMPRDKKEKNSLDL